MLLGLLMVAPAAHGESSWRASACATCSSCDGAPRAQDNMYRLGLLTHLQREEVPLKVPECLRDLRAAYEAACIEDIYDAYAQARGPPPHDMQCTLGHSTGAVAAGACAGAYAQRLPKHPG